MQRALSLLWVDDEIEQGIKDQIKYLLLDGYHCEFHKDEGNVTFLLKDKEQDRPDYGSKNLLTLRFTKYWDVALTEITSASIKISNDHTFHISNGEAFKNHDFDVSVIDIFLQYRDPRIRTQLEGYILVLLANIFKADKSSKVIAATGYPGRISDNLDKLLIQHVAEHFIRDAGEYLMEDYKDYEKPEAMVAKARDLIPIILKHWKNKVSASISLYEKGKIIETLNTIMNNFSSFNFDCDSFFAETLHWLNGDISSLYHVFPEEIKAIMETEDEGKFDTTRKKLLDPLCKEFRRSKVATLVAFYEAYRGFLHPSSEDLDKEETVKTLSEMQYSYLNKQNDLEHLGNEVKKIIDKTGDLSPIQGSLMNSLLDEHIKKHVRLTFDQGKRGYSSLSDIVRTYFSFYECRSDLQECYCFTDVITFQKGFCNLLEGIKKRGGGLESVEVEIDKIDDKAIIKIEQHDELDLAKMKEGYGTSDWANQLYQCCDFRLQFNGGVYRWYANEAYEVSGASYLKNADFVLEFSVRGV